MKVTIHWRKVVATALLAAGIWTPRVSQAVNIPLADPSFEDYAISTNLQAGLQYAYANEYRPTSGWISNQDGAGGGTQDGVDSNWLYTSAYAELGDPSFRAAPRTGNQALHGIFQYSSQVTSAVFEAGHTYTFSVYAQGDHDSALNSTYGWDSRVWLYIFDGTKPFSEPNSLIFQRFSPTDSINTGPSNFVNRDPLWNAAESQAAWQQISLSWTVQPGAPEIGHPIGVGMFIGRDGAVDDASLVSSVANVPGDFNGDGKVDGADFVIWQTNFPKDNGGTLATGDANGDGKVDGADFVIWQTHFPYPPGGSTAVPEPQSVVLFVGALASLFGLRRLGMKAQL